MQTSPLLRPWQVARMLECSEGHLSNLRCYGSGPDYIKGEKGLIYYDLHTLIEWAGTNHIRLNIDKDIIK